MAIPVWQQADALPAHRASAQQTVEKCRIKGQRSGQPVSRSRQWRSLPMACASAGAPQNPAEASRRCSRSRSAALSALRSNKLRLHRAMHRVLPPAIAATRRRWTASPPVFCAAMASSSSVRCAVAAPRIARAGIVQHVQRDRFDQHILETGCGRGLAAADSASALVARAVVWREGPGAGSNQRRACGPSTTGMRASSRIRSNRCAPASATASAPSLGRRRHRDRPGLMASRKNARLNGLSSATSTWPMSGTPSPCDRVQASTDFAPVVNVKLHVRAVASRSRACDPIAANMRSPNDTAFSRRGFFMQSFEVEIDSLTHDGRGVARVEGKAVFVAGALPGERALVRYAGTPRHYDEAPWSSCCRDRRIGRAALPALRRLRWLRAPAPAGASGRSRRSSACWPRISNASARLRPEHGCRR